MLMSAHAVTVMVSAAELSCVLAAGVTVTTGGVCATSGMATGAATSASTATRRVRDGANWRRTRSSAWASVERAGMGRRAEGKGSAGHIRTHHAACC